MQQTLLCGHVPLHIVNELLSLTSPICTGLSSLSQGPPPITNAWLLIHHRWVAVHTCWPLSHTNWEGLHVLSQGPTGQLYCLQYAMESRFYQPADTPWHHVAHPWRWRWQHRGEAPLLVCLSAVNLSNTHANVIHKLNVYWYGLDPDAPGGFKQQHLLQLGYVSYDNPDAFGFLDPAVILWGSHVIPASAYGEVADLLPPAKCTTCGWRQHWLSVLLGM